MKFISHLDMNRLMTRSLKKASIPVWFTEGFNPHPYMTFSMPLSLGHESMCESFDIRLVEDVELSEVKDRLNSVMPVGVEIQDVAEPVNKTSEIDRAVYCITFYDTDTVFTDKLKSFVSRNNIQVEKSGKRGKVTVVNLAEKLEDVSVDFADNMTVLKITLPSGNTENINPSLLIKAFSDTLFDLPAVDILREKLLCSGVEFK